VVDILRVGMIGPGLDVPGGMTAVHRTWLESQAFSHVEVQYFETMGEGSFLEKVGKNVLGQTRFVSELARAPSIEKWPISSRPNSLAFQS
jgi:hypothetical protein